MLKNNLAFLLVISLVSQMALQQNVYAVPMESVVSENTYEDESQIQDAAVLVDSSNSIERNLTAADATSSLDGPENLVGSYFPELMDAPLVNSDTLEELVGGATEDAKYDPRQGQSNASESVVTSVKNQNPYGTCWAFGATSCMEASYNTNEGVTGSAALDNINFSERHLAYYTYNDSSDASDPLGNTAGDSNLFYVNNVRASILEGLDYGGNAELAMQTYAKGIGPALESDVPYSGVLSAVDDNYKYTSSSQLLNSRVIDMSQHNLVKQMIITYGAVESSYYHINSYMNYNNGVYCYNNSSSSSNHAISIVGWDDDFSASNFNSTPSQDGAWLVKNSWGTGYYSSGYFWMSYDTTDKGTLGGKNGYAFESAEMPSDMISYEYDGSYYPCSVSLSSGTSLSNIYTVQGIDDSDYCEVLDHIMFGMKSESNGYSVQIYLNPSSTNPSSGTAMLSTPVTGTTTAAGYYSVPLNESLTFDEGDTFSVVITLTGSDVRPYLSGSGNYIYNSSDYIACVNTTEYGQSFYKKSKGSWTDWKSNGNGSYCARVKAYTTLKKMVSVESVSLNTVSANIYTGNSIDLEATVSPANAYHATVSYRSSDTSVATVDEAGTVLGVSKGSCEITAYTKNGTYDTCSVTVMGKPAEVTFDTGDDGTISTKTYEMGTAYGSLPIPQKQYYTFGGWYLDQNYTASKKVVATDLVQDQSAYTLYAKWNSISANISFDSNGGSTVKNIVLSLGDVYGSLPVSYRSGYNFTGWYFDSSCSESQKVTATTIVTKEEVTLTAGWKEKEIEELSFSLENVSLDRGTQKQLSVKYSPTDGNYQSLEYSSSESGTVSVNESGKITGNKKGSAVITATMVVDQQTLTASCNVVVNGYTGILATAANTNLAVGSTIDKDAIKVIGYYTNGNEISENIDSSAFQISPETVQSLGKNEITISYPEEELTTVVNITGQQGEQVLDYTPVLLEDSVILDTAKTEQGVLHIQPAYDSEVSADSCLYEKEGISYNQVSTFQLENKSNAVYTLSVNDKSINGKYSLYIKTQVDNQNYYLPISITIQTSKPSVKASTTAVNAFLSDESSRTSQISFSGEEVTIQSVSLDSALNSWYQVSLDEDDQQLKLILKTDQINQDTVAKDIASTGYCYLTTKEYNDPIAVKLKISISMKSPKLVISPVTAIINSYGGSSLQKEISVTSKTGESVTLSSVEANGEVQSYVESVSVNSTDSFCVKLKSQAVSEYAKAKKAEFYLYSDAWNKAVLVTEKIQVISEEPELQIQDKTVKLNRSYANVYTETKLIGNAVDYEAGYSLSENMITVVAKNISSVPSVKVVATDDPNVYLLRFYNRSTVTKGSYKYYITPQTETGYDLKQQVCTVKVYENSGTPAITAKAVKGSKFYLSQGDQAEQTFQLTLKKLDGEIIAANTSESTPFEYQLDSENQQLIVSVAADATVEKKKYQIPFTYTVLDPAGVENEISSILTVNPRNQNIKIAYSQDSYVYSKKGSYSNSGQCMTMNVTLPYSDASIGKLSLVATDAPDGAFTVVTNTSKGIAKFYVKDQSLIETGNSYTFTMMVQIGNQTTQKKIKATIKIVE